MAGDSFSVSGIVIPISIIRTGDKAGVTKIQQELKSLTGTIQQLNKEQQKTTNVARSAEEAQKTYTDSINKGTWGTKSATTVSRKYYDEQRKGMVTLKETTQTNLSLVDTMNQLRWTMVNVTFAITAMAGLAYPFYALAKAAGEFELQLKKIQAVTGGMPELTGGLILDARAGRPFERGEVADAFLQFAKAGFSAVETADALPGILDMAQAGMMDLSDAASLTAQVLAQFSSETLTASDVADVLVKAADTSRASVEGLGLALSYVGPFAEQLGISLRETTATLQILNDRGLNAQKAGTAFRQMLAAMVDPSVKAQKALDEMGVALFDTGGNFKGVDRVIREFSIALGDMPLEEKAKLLGSVFEIRAMAAVNVLMSAFGDASISVAAYTSALNDVGIAHEKAGIIGDASINNLKSAWNDFKDAFISTGTLILKGIAPIITGILKIGTSITKVLFGTQPTIEDITASLGDQSEAVQQLAKKYEELNGATLNLQAELGVASTKGTTFTNKMRELVEQFTDGNDAFEISTGIFKILEDHFVNFSNVAGVTTTRFDEIGEAIKAVAEDIKTAENNIMLLTQQKEILDKEIKILNNDLSIERNELKALNEEYQNITKSIKELSSARFTGETRTLSIIGKANLWLKKEQLATMGVGDAQAYINEQLSRSNNEYDDLFERLSNINSVMGDNTDAFKAWEESIKSAIRAEVEAGEELVSDVTNRIRTWQTALLGIQDVSKGGGEKTGLDDYINKLQLAYDVHFGGMRDDVKTFMMEQEDLQRGTYGSSAEVIALLNEEYAKLPGILSAIAITEADIDSLAGQLLAKEQELLAVTNLIDLEKQNILNLLTLIGPLVTEFALLQAVVQETTQALLDQKEAELKAVESDLINEVNVPKGEKGLLGILWSYMLAISKFQLPIPPDDFFQPVTTGGLAIDPAELFPAAPNLTVNPSLGLGNDLVSSIIKSDDVLLRPGQSPIQFHPQDTIMATKGGQGMGGTQNITVNMNATGDLGYDAYQLAREIKMELAR